MEAVPLLAESKEVKEDKVCGLDIKEKLGEGTFSNVFKVVDPQDGKEKALKATVTDTTMGIPELNEISILSTVHHPNIMSKDGLIFSPSCPNRVGIFIPLKVSNLGNIPEDTSWWQLRSILFQVASALEELHRNSILHLDLKPKNILWNYDEDKSIHAYISDFGLSAYVKDINVGSSFIYDKYTPGYRPYENLKSSRNKRYNAASDIWALGQTAMALFTRLPLYEEPSDSTPSQWMEIYLNGKEQIIHSVKTFVEGENYDVDVEQINLLADLISLTLDLNPKNRPTIRQVLEHKFFEGLTPISPFVTVPSTLVPRSVMPEVEVFLHIISRCGRLFKMYKGDMDRCIKFGLYLLYKQSGSTNPVLTGIAVLISALSFYSDCNLFGHVTVDDVLENLDLKYTFSFEDVLNEQIRIIKVVDGQLYQPNILPMIEDLTTLLQVARRPELFLNLITTNWETVPDLDNIYGDRILAMPLPILQVFTVSGPV